MHLAIAAVAALDVLEGLVVVDGTREFLFFFFDFVYLVAKGSFFLVYHFC